VDVGRRPSAWRQAVHQKPALRRAGECDLHRQDQSQGYDYAGEHEAIVDAKTWERVQRFLGRNSATRREHVRNKYGALLHGLVHCVPCDAPMFHTYTVRGSKRYRYYVCYHAQQHGWNKCETKSVAAPAIESAVVQAIRNLGADEELTRRTVEHARAQVAARIEQLRGDEKAGKGQLQRLHSEMVCAATVAGDENGAAARFDRLVEVHKEVQEIESRLASIREEMAALEDDPLDAEDVLAELRRFDGVWDSMRMHQQMRLVNLVVQRVGYDGRTRKVTVAFRSQGMRELCSGRRIE
jgi:site-specific DNA recombinase